MFYLILYAFAHLLTFLLYLLYLSGTITRRSIAAQHACDEVCVLKRD